MGIGTILWLSTHREHECPNQCLQWSYCLHKPIILLDVFQMVSNGCNEIVSNRCRQTSPLISSHDPHEHLLHMLVVSYGALKKLLSQVVELKVFDVVVVFWNSTVLCRFHRVWKNRVHNVLKEPCATMFNSSFHRVWILNKKVGTLGGWQWLTVAVSEAKLLVFKDVPLLNHNSVNCTLVDPSVPPAPIVW